MPFNIKSCARPNNSCASAKPCLAFLIFAPDCHLPETSPYTSRTPCNPYQTNHLTMSLCDILDCHLPQSSPYMSRTPCNTYQTNHLTKCPRADQLDVLACRLPERELQHNVNQLLLDVSNLGNLHNIFSTTQLWSISTIAKVQHGKKKASIKEQKINCQV